VEWPAFQGQAGQILHATLILQAYCADSLPVPAAQRRLDSTSSRSQAIFELYHHGALTVDPHDSFNLGAKMEQVGDNRR